MRAFRKTNHLWKAVVPAGSSALLTYMVLALIVHPIINGDNNPQSSADSRYTFTGCRYDPESIDPISYRFFSVGSDYETAFKEAEEEWDDTSAPGYFKEHSSSLDPGVNVTDDEYLDTWGGFVGNHCNIYASSPSIGGIRIGNHTGNEVELKFNTRVMDSLSATDKKFVAMHELGHAYGIDHVSSGCRLMRENLDDYNSCGTDIPSADDIDGVAELYK